MSGAAPSPVFREGKGHVLLAQIGAAHGVRGEVRVKSFTGEPFALAGYDPLMSGDGRAFSIERLRPDKNVVVVKFVGVDDRDAAERLNGLRLYVPHAALPELSDEDEFYHVDLIGLLAVSQDGAMLGTVMAVHDFGAGDVLEVAPASGPTLLVPFTKAAVPVVDPTGGRLLVDPVAAGLSDDERTEESEFSG